MMISTLVSYTMVTSPMMILTVVISTLMTSNTAYIVYGRFFVTNGWKKAILTCIILSLISFFSYKVYIFWLPN